MMSNIKAELRKLFTIRSSYMVLLVCLAFTVLFAFYGTGFHAGPSELHNPSLLANQAVDAISFLAVIGSLVAVLLVTHEYRYNTVNYTLAASKSRSQVFVAKILAITPYALVFSALFAVLAPLLAIAGLHAHDLHYVPQTLEYGNLAWRVLLVGWAFFMFAYILALIIRNQVGALVTVFLFPGVIQQLLELVFRGNSKYLPYHALNNVLNAFTMSHEKAAIVVAVYIVVGWIIAWMLFLRRDAS